jgi:hypothetical protein
MRVMFNKIDTNTDDLIDWDDFSEFMLLRAEGQKLMKESDETQLFETSISQGLNTPHMDAIMRIHYSTASKRFVTVSRDSTVCYWSESLRLQRVFKSVGIKSDFKKNEYKSIKNLLKQKWAQDFLMMENLYSMAIATDDHEISIYGMFYH